MNNLEKSAKLGRQVTGPKQTKIKPQKTKKDEQHES